MDILDFRDQSIEDEEDIFPREVFESPWVLFHGTTNVSASLIETEGFKWNDAIYTKSDVEEILTIYRKMDWWGINSDGYFALSTYTVSQDFADSKTKPTFFSDLPSRTIGFTNKRRFAGETAGCLAVAISDLRAILDNESNRNTFRRERYEKVLKTIRGAKVPQYFSGLSPERASANDCRALAAHWASLVGHQCVFPELQTLHPHESAYDPWEEDFEWLSAKLKSTIPLQKRLASLSDAYQYGVIYAVEFNKADVSSMKNLNSGWKNGIAYYGGVPSNRIVAKTMISPRQHRLATSTAGLACELARLKNGIVGALMPAEEKQAEIEKFELFSK